MLLLLGRYEDIILVLSFLFRTVLLKKIELKVITAD